MQRKLSLITVIVLAWGTAALLAIMPVRAAAPRVEAGSPASGPSDVPPIIFFVTYTVNITQDVPDANLLDDICDVDLGQPGDQCSLRAAVQQASAYHQGGYNLAVVVPAGRYTLTIPPAGNDDGASGDLNIISRSVRISGAGVGNTIIRGPLGWNDRLFHVHYPTHVEISGLTLQNANAGAGNGGLILNEGNLTLRAVVLKNSGATQGGGIWNKSYLTLDGSTVFNNGAVEGGGGIYNNIYGVLTVLNSTIDRNAGGGIVNTGWLLMSGSTITGNYGALGAGIVNSGTAVISNSATINNSSMSNGGGIANAGVLTLTNSVVLTNSASNDGGGIYQGGSLLAGVLLALDHSTVSGNAAGRWGGGISNWANLLMNDTLISANHTPQNGGGLHNLGRMAIANSTISSNEGFGGGGIDNAGGALALTNARIISNTAAGGGGGIANYGMLTLTESLVMTNTATSGVGGGIFDSGGAPLLVEHSTVQGNSAQLSGGGIFNAGLSVLASSTVSGNRSKTNGGGIYSIGSVAALTVSKSTLSDNSAAGNGGGIQSGGVLAASNSTLNGNRATYSGGGIFIDTGVSETAQLNNVSLANNSAGLNADGVGHGGGVFVTATATLKLQNSIVAGNLDYDITTPAHPDCAGTLNSLGYNLIQNTSGCTISGTTTGNLTGVDPKLGPLQNNGGATPTQALLAGSPAIDAGNPAGCTDSNGNLLATDQRGVPRPQGPRCDSGAFEFALLRVLLPLIVR